MAVRVVTDSSADLPRALADEMGIVVVPLIVTFGAESFLDGVTLDPAAFYRRLGAGGVFPATAQPTPAQFAEAYARVGAGAGGIVSIHASSTFSGTFNSARQAAAGAPTRTEVVDSRTTSSAMGLAVLEAARAARAGASLDEVLDRARAEVAASRICFSVETLEFLARGGRIGRAKQLVGTVLRIRPVLTIRDGVVSPLAQTRTRAQALETLVRFVAEQGPAKALSVGYSTDRAAAEALAARLAAGRERPEILLTQLGPAIGTHVGPGCLSVALLKAP
jgi:DegV family protein with EDD domain